MLNYKPLSQLIIENKESLATQLVGKYTSSDIDSVRQICVKYIHSLTNKNGEYMTQLSLLEQDIIAPTLSMFINIPIEALLVTVLNNAPAINNNIKEVNESDMPLYKHLTGHIISAICGAIGAALIGEKSIVIGIIVGTIIGSLIGFRVFRQIKNKYKLQHRVSKCIDDSKLDWSPKLSIDDVNHILDYLSNLAISIDDTLYVYRSHIKQLTDDHKRLMDKNTLDNRYKDIIETIQYVLGNMSLVKDTDPALSEDTIRRINSCLAHHGYKVIHYSEEVKSLFQVEFRHVTIYDEFKPAIVRVVEGQEYLICKGTVVIPNNNLI